MAIFASEIRNDLSQKVSLSKIYFTKPIREIRLGFFPEKKIRRRVVLSNIEKLKHPGDG